MAEHWKKAFVCGHPIVHSRSPKLHGYWLAEYGIEGSYEAIDIDPLHFDAFMADLYESGFAGGNITLPHKEAAFRAAEHYDDASREIGAVNTLWFEEGELFAMNTDVYGFLANLDEHAPGWSDDRGAAVVLGAGGAARAVLYALKARGFGDIRIVNRTVERAQMLVSRFGPAFSAHSLEAADSLLSDCSLVVNTTALGMHGKDSLDVDLNRLPDHALVTDIVYVPLETPLLAAAGQRGLKTVDGLGMLLHQAVRGFELWFGRRPEVTAELRALVEADLTKT